MENVLNRVQEACYERSYCNGRINCPWLTPNDEANCTECPSNRPNRCDCNQEGNFTCEWDGDGFDWFTCYHDDRK